jgi:hypothetical protein
MPRVLDDAAYAPAERRMLLPVRDVGLAAVLRIRESPASSASATVSAHASIGVRVRVRVGGFVIPWQIKAAGRYGLVAGRLDGHLVGAVWPLEDGDGQTKHTNSCLPPLPPTTWDIAQPWPDGIVADADTDADADTNTAPPSLGLGLDNAALDDAGLGNTGGAGRNEADALIEQIVVWRDLLHRPAADGVVEWRLGPASFLMLGDFPSGSRDSRQWGPLDRAALRSRAMPVP